MLMKLICSVSSNQSHGEYPECRSERESTGEASLLVSPLVVAGIVIGLVLFLSCITIIVGSFRKDSRLRNPHLRASYGPDGFSYGGSVGELRSTCLEDFPPPLDYHSYRDTLSQVNTLYPDSPPRYDECVGPGSTQIYIPTDDPPPYSLLDPCQGGTVEEGSTQDSALHPSAHYGETSASATWFPSSDYQLGLQEHQHIASISFPLEAAPPYESVLAEQGQPLPLMPCDLYKHHSERGGDSGGAQQPGANQILQDH
ncbi:protein BEAN1 [Synchiropus splendidus]|uniref:protein BEAN1 n=1 Tax=Synchiropus splendidus TaxID=270530 RepID=UPI00237EDB62|nr:protein BEAN1 [Synchiropus splendidus]